MVDNRVALVQMKEETALRFSRMCEEIERLPDVPHPLYPPLISITPIPTTQDTFIQRLVNKVNQDSIRAKMQRLQNFQTRFALTDSCRAAEQYVFDYFRNLGLDSVVFDTCYYQGRMIRNVIGTCVGLNLNPRHLIIICGHLDAVSEDTTHQLAPGAEDNASGVCMAIEAARVLARENLNVTVKFIAFAGEELINIGSYHYAQILRNQNVDIPGTLNFDMVAWAGDSFGVTIGSDTFSMPLAQLQGQMAGMYTPLHYRIQPGLGGSDHRSFQRLGYPATIGTEYGHGYPFYHSTGDTIGNLSIPLAAEVAKLGVATLATLALTHKPAFPDDFVVCDPGCGGSIDCAWLPNPEPDLAGYKLFWGTISGTYADSVTLGRVTSHRITGLQNYTRYYVTIAAFDSLGYESIQAPEVSAIPTLIPFPPSGLAALPFYFGMRLTWLRNTERDLAGYNLYRSTTPGGNYTKLNSSPFPDTAYRDSSLLSDTMYYYVVTAVDTSRNESGYSSEVRGKPITLDHGILLVDETRNGTGQQGSPNDAQKDAYYHYLLQGSRFLDWDVTQQGIPLAGDVGPYSTIVWHADDYQDQRVYPAVSGLTNYLSYGGRLWMVGWKPIFGLMNRTGTYPYTFSLGQFPYDYLHLSRSTEAQLQDYIGAGGQSGYPNLSVDSMKVFASWHGKLPYIDAVFPRNADTVFTFNSASGDTAFQGKPVGVRWLRDPGRVVFFGFPFYFMKDSEARQVAIKVLQDLGEPVGVEAGTPNLPLTTALLPVYPNPSRGSFRIEYALAEKGRVRVSVYNVAGQLVRELVDKAQAPGRYSVSWDGRDREAHRLPSGVYFYRLQTKTFSDMKKAVVVK